MIKGVKFNQMVTAEEDEVDYELTDTNGMFSTHANVIPATSAVPGTRTFYGSRFFEQALPLVDNEAPLVRNLETKSGRSFDFVLGEAMGARRAKSEGLVEKVTPDEIVLKRSDGTRESVELFNNFPGNRKTLSNSTAKVRVGQPVKPGDLLAKSNFTDDEGRMALGRNAVIGVLPYKGYSMDDAVVISESFAKKLTSEHAETLEQEADDTIKADKNHYVSLFAKTYTREQLDKIGPDGIVKVGTILSPGDPVMLLTKPRTFSSKNENVGRLSRAQRFVRKDASQIWDGKDPAEVLEVARTRDGGVKVLVKYTSPSRPADKMVLRSGQKGTISLILPDDKMPRTESGQPLDVMMNQLGFPSRVNSSGFYELLLGKIAAKTGKAYTLPAFLPPDKPWYQFVRDELDKHGVSATERIYDPESDAFLDNPVTVGNGHILKLHHTAAGKMRSRGQAGYSMDNQPLRGGSDGGGAQRLSSLEMNVLHSSGGRGVQREAILLRGENRPDYWRQLRANRTPPALDKPFVWEKFMALLAGTGVNAKDLGKGRLRLTPMTDSELQARGSMKIENDGIVDLSDFTPKPGGLFDPYLVREQKWGHVELPFPVINPSYEETVRVLLGLTKPQYEALMEDEAKEEKSLLTDALTDA